MPAPKNPMNKKGRAAAGKKVVAKKAAELAAERAATRKAVAEAAQMALPIPTKKLKAAGKLIRAVAKGKPARKPTPPGMAKHYADQARAILAEPNPHKRKRMSRNIKPFVPTIPKLNKTRKKRSK
jgi:hypothetical protein